MKTLIGISLFLITCSIGFSQVPNDKNKEPTNTNSKSDTTYLMDLAAKTVGMAIHGNQDSLNDYFREIQILMKRLNLTSVDIYKMLLSKTQTETKKVDIQIVISYFYRTSNSDSALFYGQNALKLARQIKYAQGEAYSLASLGFVNSGFGNYPTALEMQLKSLQIFEKLNIAEGKGLAYERIGLNYAESGDYSNALIYLYKSKNVYDSINHNTMFTTEQSNIGGVYSRLNQLDSALDYSLKAYVNIRKYKVDFLKPYNLNVLGEIYAKKGETQRALDYFHQALVVSYNDNENNASSLTNYNIAKLYQQINLPDSSIYYAEKALFEAQKGKYYQTMIVASTLLSELYESKDSKKTIFYNKLTIATKDSLSYLWKNNAYKNITNFDEQERKIDIETAENRIKQYAFLSGLAMLLLVAFILYRNNQQKRKANGVLENTLTDLKASQSELEIKNRDLEIETALDKVRARSLEMQRSDELKEVVATLYEQLRHLGFQYGAACIFIMDKETNDLVQWVSGFNQSEYPIGYYIKHFNHPVYEAQFTAWKNDDKYIELLLAGEEKKVFDEYMFTQTDFKNFPEQGKAFMQSLQSVVFSLAFLKHGALQWGPEKLNDEQAKILQKFAVVFEQAYTRFLDLQKAEAQTREAQIELALERVRSRTMAMHHSNEMIETASILFQQLKDLGLEFWTCGFCIWRMEDTPLIENWMNSGDSGGFLSPILLPFKEDDGHLNIYEASLRGESVYEFKVEGAELTKHYNWLMSNPSAKVVFDQLKKSGIKPPPVQYKYAALFKQGYLLMISAEPKPNTNEIAKRFAKVFEQTYTRFLDLQKAEAQAREAEIEVALERVRSKTMAMRSSDDVTTAIETLFTELEKLGVNNLRCGIVNIHANKTMGVWSVNNVENLKSVKGAGIFDMNAHIMWQHLYESWAKKEEFFYYFLTDKEKEDYVKVLNAKPNYLPQAVQQFPDMNFQAYCYDEGGIWTFSLQPHSETDKQLMQRFTSVFSLTFRRYQDLQNVEAQAEQARLDLILIQTEKKRAEDALSELRITQNQLIQKEKLASLGELTAGIAHEIQNPLNFVNNFSELSVDLAKDINDEIHRPDIDKGYVEELLTDLTSNQEKINHHGKRASSIVKGMLEHSRASTGVRELTDINKLADEYLRLSYHGLRAKDKEFNADFSTDLDGKLPKINVVPQDIGRVLLNLINNAFYAVNERKHAPQPPEGEPYVPTVIVSTHYLAPLSGAGEEQIIIKVKDNGTGMPESVRGKVFQPFFTTKPTGSGTGLGLSLAYDIVTKGHGGTLEVESNEGEGAVFIIRFVKYNNIL